MSPAIADASDLPCLHATPHCSILILKAMDAICALTTGAAHGEVEWRSPPCLQPRVLRKCAPKHYICTIIGLLAPQYEPESEFFQPCVSCCACWRLYSFNAI
jgi:hypothetical protein